VTKNNVSILVATALLGVLLYVILTIFGDIDVIKPVKTLPQSPVETDADAVVSTDPETSAKPAESASQSDIPGIATYDDLLRLLNDRGLEGEQLIATTAKWFQARGFLGPDALLGITDAAAPMSYYETLDELTLKGMSSAGDMGASQTLASHSRFIDPFEAMTLYETAGRQGSIKAMLQIASLYETFDDIELDQFESDQKFQQKIRRFRPQGSGSMTNRRDFGFAMAAVRDGGRPVANPEVVQWIQSMAASMPEAVLTSACKLSERLFINASETRRQAGFRPLSTIPPSVFLGDPELDQILPCQNTPYSFYQVLNLDNCTTEPVRDAAGRSQHLYICVNQ
jgi:hypothetical protein